ncbi:hypothetical protein [Sphingomonas montanisoli]|uniref:Uncharacterized protein n=1 Tax=Sphingomonas montanisoli TaxID=2606412 RepID=A0A5D9CCW8_9SPHN|nr:hypothetical protein [Sphingomonas montanisoli]TZG27991.1 hypothetical protein FYJ91_10685 [Sphingomonas montanisoli]
MEIVKLAPGAQPPETADYVAIVEEDGQFGFSGQIEKIHGPMKASVYLIGPEWYPSFDEALTAGLVWADSHGAGRIYVEVAA